MKSLIWKCILVPGLLLCIYTKVYCDEPGPPPPPSEHGMGGNQGPAGAPIDGGLGILISMGVLYGGKKYLQSRKLKKVS